MHHQPGRDQYYLMIKWTKAKVCVYADSVLCVGQVKDISGATERWKGQVEGLTLYSSSQDAVAVGGEPTKLEWNNFPGFSSFSLFFARSRTTWRQKNIKPEDFKDRVIFMSMLNDIVRKKNGENCISNAEEVRTYATKFTQGHWTFLGPGSEEKRYGDSHDQEETVELHRQQKCTAIQTDWSSCLQKHQCFESWNLEAKDRQMYHSLQWRFYKYRTLVPNSSLCQPALSVFGAVANWCYQFGLIGDGKGRIAVLVNN